jgi:hypothetical protein
VYKVEEPISDCLQAHFFARHERAKKPGFPLQVLGFAYANPVGFPFQIHCLYGIFCTKGRIEKNETKKQKR